MQEKNIKISVEHFGPIAKARDIVLSPLTVFVGPSNTGKSYLAVLIYALFKSLQIGDFFHSLSRIIRRRRDEPRLFDDPDATISNEVSNFLTKSTKKETKTANFLDLPESLQAFLKEEMGQALAQAFHEELPRCMGISTKENQLIADKFLLHFEDHIKSFTLKSLGETADTTIKNFSFDKRSFHRLMSMPEKLKTHIFLDSVLEGLFGFFHETEAFYLPAARTGIMQSHQAITGALVKRAPFAGLEPVSVPALSGIVSDFLHDIINMDRRQGKERAIAKIADDMEEKILKGSIKTKSSDAIQYPQFLYRQNGLEIPLLCSSSMVSELAPVVLFIRHRIGKNDLLIIEEPEAHLHPEAQREIAKVVVHLVRAGVRVLATTHSDYFLEQLSNYVRLSKLMKSRPDEFPDHQNAFLEEDEISAYVFNRQTGGTIVEQLRFDQENGLSPEDHDQVSSSLYNQTVEILEQSEQQKIIK